MVAHLQNSDKMDRMCVCLFACLFVCLFVCVYLSKLHEYVDDTEIVTRHKRLPRPEDGEEAHTFIHTPYLL